MRAPWLAWMPALVLGLGALITVGIDTQRALPLRASLSASVPETIGDHVSRDIEISEAERRVARVTDYLLRTYAPADTLAGQAHFSVYVGYYSQQSQGKTIHSPKNCLPGTGWEALESRTAEVPLSGGGVAKVNRYLLQREDDRALVLYWYQGRGRVQANEYVVKWDLLRDSALKGRSDEALVRIVVPVAENVDAAFDFASDVAATLIPALEVALPS